MLRLARLIALASLVLIFNARQGAFAQPAHSAMPQVNGGQFTVREQQSADLLGRGIILSVVRVMMNSSGEARSVAFTINGTGGASSVGVRRDLKAQRKTRDLLKDKSVCAVTLVAISATKGAPNSATFNLTCN